MDKNTVEKLLSLIVDTDERLEWIELLESKPQITANFLNRISSLPSYESN